ncbi:UxaA family hydrolase [Gallaecimonas pentaromativorans]|uniref:D-altronate dehydratase n=1 Tax=Gallaecimonas pentaromativorans TaxID=584787 RepID=A0A3N1PDS3_9GAMM|nr:altronate dehydratase family protein [Gallaecimonas pentaromativorans]ROQ25998.1 D-altronate dehydratase [Gallaecimonas pentaromativorans]
MKVALVKVHPKDNVAVATKALEKGSRHLIDGQELVLATDLPAGHKVALSALAAGENVVKYGFAIGSATSAINQGEHVHSHNLATNLSGAGEYRYQQVEPSIEAFGGGTFMGYRRKNGRVGTRNEVWIVNTVGCVNAIAQRIASRCEQEFAGIADAFVPFVHPYGCSQLGDDLNDTRAILAALINHPNAGAVLVVGLGCENNQLNKLLEAAGDIDSDRVRFFNSQQVHDEVEAGVEAIGQMLPLLALDKREPCPASELVLGMKCGGSDGFSGITANPLVGRMTDRFTALGGTVLLTETPEMFGAEQVLMNRAKDSATFEAVVKLVQDFKQYFIDHKQPVFENPSPGNKAGGLTTLEEKSLGAIQKGGQAQVQEVLAYGEPVHGRGLALLQAPGNDAVSSTALAASGATLILFTTGRGTPLGFPVPTVKISSNSDLYQRKGNWIDFNAGELLDGVAMDDLSQAFFERLLAIASGELTCNERNHSREIAIWKRGVTL